MGAKIFFSCFRRFHFLKHTFNFYTFPKWENAINTKYNTKPLPASAICEMWSWQLPRSNYRYDNPECSREDRLARNYANFFNISLAGFLFFLAFGSSALCGDDKDFCTPAKKLRKEPLFLLRTLKIEKRKSRTLAARAEICRRRLFEVESENSSPTSTIEPRVLRERKESPQISTQISVS